ncbi:44666_t:CDS:2, partial [Gigaspora margarita]
LRNNDSEVGSSITSLGPQETSATKGLKPKPEKSILLWLRTSDYVSSLDSTGQRLSWTSQKCQHFISLGNQGTLFSNPDITNDAAGAPKEENQSEQVAKNIIDPGLHCAKMELGSKHKCS